MSTSVPGASRTSARLKLLLLALVCAAPVIGSYLLYYVAPPEGGKKNYGELIPQVTVAALTPRPDVPIPADLAPVAGKWLLVMVDSGACGDGCTRKLWQARQLRLTQGKEMDRIVRVWLVDDGVVPGEALRKEYDGTVILPRARFPELAKLPATGTPRDHLYVIDPIGNLMMRFPADPDLNRVKKDLVHLLKVSRIG
jgi:hypothetical protein